MVWGGTCHCQGLPQARLARQKVAMSKPPHNTTPAKGDRIAKVIARSGLCSRRDAESWIADGRVKLNGKLLGTPAITVTDKDRIEVDGEPLPQAERTRLWLYHKDKGVITAARDPEGRKVLRDVLPKELKTAHPVGRLDFNTEGLLLLTNDGGLKRLLELPSTGWLRRYRVRAFGEAPEHVLNKARKGMEIEGVHYGPMEIVVERQQGDNQWLTVGLREGKNREVKVVLGALGLQVNRLIRISYGPFQLGELETGAAQEVRTRVLKDQLSGKVFKDAGLDFDGPMRTPVVGRDTPARPKKPEKTGRGASGNAPLRKGRGKPGPDATKRGKPGFVTRPGAAKKSGPKRGTGGRGPQKTRGR
jgi:23S rRNA pseudouridine2605 synthase